MDRGAFYPGHVRFYRGVCRDTDQARELTTGEWKGMWQCHRSEISMVDAKDRAQQHIMANLHRWKCEEGKQVCPVTG